MSEGPVTGALARVEHNPLVFGALAVVGILTLLAVVSSRGAGSGAGSGSASASGPAPLSAGTLAQMSMASQAALRANDNQTALAIAHERGATQTELANIAAAATEDSGRLSLAYQLAHDQTTAGIDGASLAAGNYRARLASSQAITLNEQNTQTAQAISAGQQATNVTIGAQQSITQRARDVLGANVSIFQADAAKLTALGLSSDSTAASEWQNYYASVTQQHFADDATTAAVNAANVQRDIARNKSNNGILGSIIGGLFSAFGA